MNMVTLREYANTHTAKCHSRRGCMKISLARRTMQVIEHCMDAEKPCLFQRCKPRKSVQRAETFSSPAVFDNIVGEKRRQIY
jgi:hypothetical protein